MQKEIPDHIRGEMITTGASNAVFNGMAAVALATAGETIPLWGFPTSIFVDLAGTSAVLLFIVALIVIPLNRSKHRKGKVKDFHWDGSRKLHRFWQRLPKGLVARAFCFSGLGIFVVAPLSSLYFVFVGVDTMGSVDYGVCKGLWAGIMSAIMCVPMIQLGLSDALPAPEGAGE